MHYIKDYIKNSYLDRADTKITYEPILSCENKLTQSDFLQIKYFNTNHNILNMPKNNKLNVQFNQTFSSVILAADFLIVCTLV